MNEKVEDERVFKSRVIPHRSKFSCSLAVVIKFLAYFGIGSALVYLVHPLVVSPFMAASGSTSLLTFSPNNALGAVAFGSLVLIILMLIVSGLYTLLARSDWYHKIAYSVDSKHYVNSKLLGFYITFGAILCVLSLVVTFLGVVYLLPIKLTYLLFVDLFSVTIAYIFAFGLYMIPAMLLGLRWWTYWGSYLIPIIYMVYSLYKAVTDRVAGQPVNYPYVLIWAVVIIVTIVATYLIKPKMLRS